MQAKPVEDMDVTRSPWPKMISGGRLPAGGSPKTGESGRREPLDTTRGTGGIASSVFKVGCGRHPRDTEAVGQGEGCWVAGLQQPGAYLGLPGSEAPLYFQHVEFGPWTFSFSL